LTKVGKYLTKVETGATSSIVHHIAAVFECI